MPSFNVSALDETYSDQELLRLASKATPYPLEGFALGAYKGMRWVDGQHQFVRFWNPLTKAGDAFRLAMLLRLDLEYEVDTVSVRKYSAAGDTLLVALELFPLGDDPDAAVLRAIVLVAASLAVGQHSQSR